MSVTFTTLPIDARVTPANADKWQEAYAWGDHAEAGYAEESALLGHTGRTDNPHAVTATQVGADAVGTAAGLVAEHEGAYVHGDIAHANRAILDGLNQALGTGAAPTFGGLAVDASTFYVDAVNHRVGIGTNSPLHALDIVGEMRIKTSGSYGNIKTPNNSRVALQILNSGNAFYGPAVFKNDSGSEKAKMTNIGLFGINTTYPTAMLHAVSGATDYPVIIAQAMTGQTANLQEWRDSTGTAKASMSATGYLSINGLGFSDSSVDGAWRITQSGNDLAFQRRESGAWVTKGTITA